MIKTFEDLKVIKPDVAKEPVQPRIGWFTEPKFYKSASVSPLQSWYEIEAAKRRQGLQNEIAVNEIKAAFRGVRNKWHKAVEKNPELFKPLSDSGDGIVNWQEILHVKQSS